MLGSQADEEPLSIGGGLLKNPSKEGKLPRWKPSGKEKKNTLKSIPFGVLLLVASAASAAPLVWTSGGVTVSLDVTPRTLLSPGPITSDGVGGFLAPAGGDGAAGVSAGCSNPALCAGWNWVWNVVNGSNAAITFKLSWDTDPAVALQVANMGYLQQTLGAGSSTGASWNLGSPFISTGTPIPGVYAPATSGFNAASLGTYTMSLQWTTGVTWSTAVTQVTTFDPRFGPFGFDGAQAPEPGTLGAVGAGLALLLLLHRRRTS